MSQLARFGVLLIVVLFAANPGPAPLSAQKPVTASKGWVKLPAASETTARAFVLVENPTMYDVYVVSAASDVAAEVQFHELKPAADGKTTIVKEITAPAYSSVELKPDGVHLVLTGLKRALKEGETITLMLTTDGGTLSVPAVVKP